MSVWYSPNDDRLFVFWWYGRKWLLLSPFIIHLERGEDAVWLDGCDPYKNPTLVKIGRY